jgi:hypothetical protein
MHQRPETDLSHPGLALPLRGEQSQLVYVKDSFAEFATEERTFRIDLPKSGSHVVLVAGDTVGVMTCHEIIQQLRRAKNELLVNDVVCDALYRNARAHQRNVLKDSLVEVIGLELYEVFLPEFLTRIVEPH